MSSQDNFFDRLYRSQRSARLAGQIPVQDAPPADPGPGRIVDAWSCVDCGALGELQAPDSWLPNCPVCEEGELRKTVACECSICGCLLSTQAEWCEHLAEAH